jgi:hypothetical protein
MPSGQTSSITSRSVHSKPGTESGTARRKRGSRVGSSWIEMSFAVGACDVDEQVSHVPVSTRVDKHRSLRNVFQIGIELGEPAALKG